MLFFFDIVSSISFIYMLVAAVPGLILLNYVYSQGRSHGIPGWLVGRLLFDGVLAALCSIIPEYIVSGIMKANPSSGLGYYLLSFLCVGLIEEGFKFLFLNKDTWNSPYFLTQYDGVEFAVTVSLGFAIFENIRYVFAYGIQVGFERAFLAIPAHLAFSVLMGIFYGKAKESTDRGRQGQSGGFKALGYVSAVLLHCAYDTFASVQSGNGSAIFIGIVIVIYLIVFLLVKKEARNDRFV